ncbi:MAG: hypothetical protein ACLSHO_10990 [Dysosmobacter sp.]
MDFFAHSRRRGREAVLDGSASKRPFSNGGQCESLLSSRPLRRRSLAGDRLLGCRWARVHPHAAAANYGVDAEAACRRVMRFDALQ